MSPFPMTDCTGGFMSDPNSEYYIPDSSIQVSSEANSYYYPARNGRLHHDSFGWYASASGDTHPWIQADLGRLVDVFGIQTQGNGDTRWVTTLKVSTFPNVPVSGDGDFIQVGNIVKVCIKRKQ